MLLQTGTLVECCALQSYSGHRIGFEPAACATVLYLRRTPDCSGILEGLGLSLQHQGCGSCETPMHLVVRRNVGTELLVIF